MGTRGLTVIVKDNQIKLSNYGQWDSYFDYTGIKFLEFCKENKIRKQNFDLCVQSGKNRSYCYYLYY